MVDFLCESSYLISWDYHFRDNFNFLKLRLRWYRNFFGQWYFYLTMRNCDYTFFHLTASSSCSVSTEARLYRFQIIILFFLTKSWGIICSIVATCSGPNYHNRKTTWINNRWNLMKYLWDSRQREISKRLYFWLQFSNATCFRGIL